MSITDFVNKIKDQIGIDGSTSLILIILVLVGLSSFGLGRLSVKEMGDSQASVLDNRNSYSVKEEIGEGVVSSTNGVVGSMKEVVENQKEKVYVASKNGKLYYKSSCSSASRIKVENMMWFSSKEEAEDSGFKMASTCK